MDRPYQDQALTAIETEYTKGVNRQLLVMATGTGKTHVFSRLPDKLKHILPGQQLILAHREELIDQALDKVRKLNPTLKADKEMGAYKCDPSACDIIVASVATLGRKGTKRTEKFNWERIDKYVTDEAHHSPADSYGNIFDLAGVLEPNSKKLLLGVTATPNGRGDGKALAAIYQKVVLSYSMRDAIEDGWLSDVRGLKVDTNTSLDGVRTIKGDFDQAELADTVNNPERNQLIYKAWKDYAEDRQTVGFTVDIKHAQDLAEMFRHYGVKAEAIWGNDPDRHEKLKAHKNKEITVLFNCGILTEGYDDWRIGCILLCRPTKSAILFTQMVGRGTRLQEGIGNLKEYKKENPNVWLEKEDCIVIDVVDSSSKNTLVTLPTLMGMSAGLNLKGRSLVQSIRTIEEYQKEYSNIDFSTLKDISKIKTFVEEVGLFDIKYPDEVETNSELSWHAAADGGFIMLLPNKDEIRIRQNLLDKWEISGTIKGRKYKGERERIEDAFQAADGLVFSEASEHLKILKREEPWHADPATTGQLMLLRKFYKGRQLPNDLTKGKASRLISNFLANKQK